MPGVYRSVLRLLSESASGLVVVDVQPLYRKWIKFDRSGISGLIGGKKVIVIYNSGDEEREVSRFVFGDRKVKAEYIRKVYGHFRDLIDAGANRDSLVELAKKLLDFGLRDWSKLPDSEIPDDLLQYRGSHNFALPRWSRFLNVFPPDVVLVGGGIDQCLAEVDILLRAHGVKTSINRNFVY